MEKSPYLKLIAPVRVELPFQYIRNVQQQSIAPLLLLLFQTGHTCPKLVDHKALLL